MRSPARFPFLFEGTLTRSVEDAAIGLTALSGYDARDPFSLEDAPDFMAALRRSVKGRRIAYSPNFDVYPIDPKVSEIVGNAVKLFEQAGAHVEEEAFPAIRRN
jgi:amidase